MKKEAMVHLILTFISILIVFQKKLDRCFATRNFNMTTSSKFNNTHDDESSLLALKASIMISNPDTLLAKNWSQGTPYCSWISIHCGSHRHPSRVTALNFSYFGLQGTIPKEIGDLSFLWFFAITNNSFSGPIPSIIGNLRRLRVLSMGNNQLSGRIPPSIGRLTKLERFSLYGNQLEGPILSTIFNLSFLYHVDFYGNQLSGTLPQGICHRNPNLQHLNLARNQLDGDISSSGLWACAQMERLSLAYDNFSGSIQWQIGNLSRLQILYLDRNYLTGVIPTSISNLSNLERLDISDNILEGIIPSEIDHLSKMSFLHFSKNKLSGKIPISLFNLSKLQELGMRGNELSGELPPFITPNGLPHLEVLYLGSNRLSGKLPSFISNLSSLTGLSLANNSFSGHIPNSLGNLSKLQILYLGANQFTNNLSIPEQDFLTPLSNCRYLNTIQIMNNSITGELPKSLGSKNLSMALEQFIADFCQIGGQITTEISNLSSLITLDISFNELVGVIPESLGSLTNLQWLGMYGNRLRGSIPESFCRMNSLFHLVLSRNMLYGYLPLCLGNLTSLRELLLDENAFRSSIPLSLWRNTGTQVLDLSQNFFNGSISQDIGSMKSVRWLDLSSNQLSGVIPDSFQHLQNLVDVSLANNMLHGPIPELLSNLKALQYLDLSHNNLSGAIPKSLEKLLYLEYFNVSFNHLSGEIPDGGTFKNFTPEFFIGNKGLCGAIHFKLEPCKSNLPKHSSKKSLLRYILPPVVAVLLILAIVMFILTRYRGKESHTSSVSNLILGSLQDRISYYDILRATNNLDEESLIGRGGYGAVYKVNFSDTMIAAVKVFNLDVQGALKSFDTECQILRSIRHRNLVKVITSCSSLDFKALVMEYMPGGNLDKWLYSNEHSLNVSQRLQIMKDVATALEYLHHGYSAPIIHCDLKPSNILLDDDMVACIGDFGIAKFLTGEKQTTAQTKTLGTIGYMAPEYGSEGIVSTMVDIYSFGIVLIETFTRRKPTDEMFSGELTMKSWLSEFFPDSLMQILDVELLNTDETDARTRYERCLTSVIGLALECTAEVPENRPNIKDVRLRIEKLKVEV